MMFNFGAALTRHSTSSVFSTAALLGGRRSSALILPVQSAAFSKNSWSFPKHRELLTEDFYDDEKHDDNPYAKQDFKGQDYEDYKKPTHRSTATGVLSSYKKQINLTAKDVIMKDYMDNLKDLRGDLAGKFDKADRLNFTKTVVDRLRLGRGVTSPIDADGDEYGNYKKFEEGKNQVKEVTDKGYDDPGLDKF